MLTIHRKIVANFVLVRSFFIAILVYPYIVPTQAIDYLSLRNQELASSEVEKILTTRDLLENVISRTVESSVTLENSKDSLQKGTEILLQFGALLRIQILETFGRHLYEYYDDFTISQVNSLHAVYLETLERNYDVLSMVPSVLEEADAKPSTICSYLHEKASIRLREYTEVCRKMTRHECPCTRSSYDSTLNRTRSIYENSKIVQWYQKGFSLDAILDHLKQGRLTLTPGLLLALLGNVRYDNYNDVVRLAERRFLRFLSHISKNQSEQLVPALEDLKDARNVGDLLKRYLVDRETRFPLTLRQDAGLLAERIVGNLETIDENIQLLAGAFDNGTIRSGYLFNLVIPDDTIDTDVKSAKDYVMDVLQNTKLLSHLEIDNYQQATPQELLLEILGKLEEINFAKDIIACLKIHARFWHKSQMIEKLQDLLMLFDAYENLRVVPKYENLIGKMDQIKGHLWDSKLVTIEILCNSPRSCLRKGLKIIAECPYLGEDVRSLIMQVVEAITFRGAIEKEECNLSVDNNVKSDMGIQTTVDSSVNMNNSFNSRHAEESNGTNKIVSPKIYISPVNVTIAKNPINLTTVEVSTFQNKEFNGSSTNCSGSHSLKANCSLQSACPENADILTLVHQTKQAGLSAINCVTDKILQGLKNNVENLVTVKRTKKSDGDVTEIIEVTENIIRDSKEEVSAAIEPEGNELEHKEIRQIKSTVEDNNVLTTDNSGRNTRDASNLENNKENSSVHSNTNHSEKIDIPSGSIGHDTTTQIPVGVRALMICENKDPDQRSKLDRLNKLRRMSALHSSTETVLISTTLSPPSSSSTMENDATPSSSVTVDDSKSKIKVNQRSVLENESADNSDNIGEDKILEEKQNNFGKTRVSRQAKNLDASDQTVSVESSTISSKDP
ncbi:uncharacterized protein [Prorops nasuta]|uniref:uncharacterized protein isoform X2 n=1 Tax=Prorops nasuta TaxID=863751 RepID=UPI0034CED830